MQTLSVATATNRMRTRTRRPVFSHLARDARGAVAVEYLVLAGCVALAGLAGWQQFGGAINDKAFCQGQAVLALSSSAGCSNATAGAITSTNVDVSTGVMAAQSDDRAEDDACADGWRGALCRLAHDGGDFVRDVVGDLPGGDFVADYATQAWSLPDAILQSTLPLFGLGGADAPGVAESWAATGKQLAALGCHAIPGTCSTLDSGLVPGFAEGEATQIQIDTAKSFVGWDSWADGEYGTAAGTLLPNLALTLAPGPKVSALGRATQVTRSDAPDTPCTGPACELNDQCFTAGTPVHAASGLVPIERIKRGDFVWSRAEKSGALGLRRVVRTFVNENKAILQIALTSASGEREALQATYEHPFWTRERGWTAARDLRVGEHALQRTGGFATVSGVHALPERADVFNFEVEEHHTYFVGEGGVWVHNRCRDASAWMHGDLEVVSREPIGVGENGAELLVVRDAAGEHTVVWKSAAAEKPGLTLGVRPGTYHTREAAMYALDRELGGETVVPPTVSRTLDGELGSMQEFVPNTFSTAAVQPELARMGVKGLSQDARLRRSFLLDLVGANVDRHGGNLQWQKLRGQAQPRAFAIDNGLAFSKGEVSHFRVAIPDETLFNALLDLDAESVRMLNGLKLNRVAVALRRAGLGSEEIRQTLGRIRALQHDPAELPWLIDYRDPGNTVRKLAKWLSQTPENRRILMRKDREEIDRAVEASQ